MTDDMYQEMYELLRKNEENNKKFFKRINFLMYGFLVFGTIGFGLSILFDASDFSKCIYLLNLLLGFNGIEGESE